MGVAAAKFMEGAGVDLTSQFRCMMGVYLAGAREELVSSMRHSIAKQVVGDVVDALRAKLQTLTVEQVVDIFARAKVMMKAESSMQMFEGMGDEHPD